MFFFKMKLNLKKLTGKKPLMLCNVWLVMLRDERFRQSTNQADTMTTELPQQEVFYLRKWLYWLLQSVVTFLSVVDYKLDVEVLGFKLTVDRLVDIGYPSHIKEFQYDPSFPIRYMWPHIVSMSAPEALL